MRSNFYNIVALHGPAHDRCRPLARVVAAPAARVGPLALILADDFGHANVRLQHRGARTAKNGLVGLIGHAACISISYPRSTSCGCLRPQPLGSATRVIKGVVPAQGLFLIVGNQGTVQIVVLCARRTPHLGAR